MAPRWRKSEEDRLISLLDKCSRSWLKLQQLHSRIIVSGFHLNNFVSSKLIRSMAELHRVDHARKVFDETSQPNEFLWNALIWGYSVSPEREFCRLAVRHYTLMRSRSPLLRPLAFTVSSALKSCSKLDAVEEGEKIHTHAFKFGFGSDRRVQTSLLDLYGGARRINEARRVFDAMLRRGGGDVQAWNSMIAACCLARDLGEARKMFDEMPNRNTFTWVEMVKGYAAPDRMEDLCGLLDMDMEKEGADRVVVLTAGMSGLLANGEIERAREVFEGMPERDIAAWNAMISGCTSAGRGDLAFDLFLRMLDDGSSVRPNVGTVVAAAGAAAQLGSAELARRVSDYVGETGAAWLANSRAAAAMIDMHAKCGDIWRAREVFLKTKCKDLVCYTAMIASLGVHGEGLEALRVFQELLAEGLKPDGICFVSVLAACSHSGLVEEGKRVFESMAHDHGVSPVAEHYVCVVDMLGRAGRIKEARRIIVEEMAPTVGDTEVVWGALMSACRSHGESAAAAAAEVEEELRGFLRREEGEMGDYVLLANVYAGGGRWEEAAEVRATMRRRGARKVPGWSWVDGGSGRVERFVTGEVREHVEIESALSLLFWEMGGEGVLCDLWDEMDQSVG